MIRVQELERTMLGNYLSALLLRTLVAPTREPSFELAHGMTNTSASIHVT